MGKKRYFIKKFLKDQEKKHGEELSLSKMDFFEAVEKDIYDDYVFRELRVFS